MTSIKITKGSPKDGLSKITRSRGASPLRFSFNQRILWKPLRRQLPQLSPAYFCESGTLLCFSDRALQRYGKVYIIQPYREQEICARACQEALGHECQCSCMGANHGIGNDGSWFEVSDTFSTRWGNRELACRLLTAR